ncbi:MAG: sigma-70 family RNA polymerase sigma factor [Proteobacteria bacterium]|nr:sigma-70 family RNA polymerase sigma factor [Pseudomonadota bacterium]
MALAFVDHIGELREPHRFRGWLPMLARNRAVSSGRKTSVRWRRLRLLNLRDLNVGDGLCVEERLAARQAAERELAVSKTLTEEQRECLMLRAVEGMTQRGIALPETTVESRLAKARRRLRAALSTGEMQFGASMVSVWRGWRRGSSSVQEEKLKQQ